VTQQNWFLKVMPETMSFFLLHFFWLLLVLLVMPEAMSFSCHSKLLKRTSAMSTKLAIGEVTMAKLLCEVQATAIATLPAGLFFCGCTQPSLFY
jgi:hypothetical protein